MRCTYELHAALGDGSCRLRFELCPNLVDDDNLRHVVLHRLDHDGMLPDRACYLHTPRSADGGMRDITIAANLVGGIDDDDPLPEVVGQNTCDLAQHCRLTDPWPTEE